MRIFGFNITREKALQQVDTRPQSWYTLVREPFAGAWQQNEEIKIDTAASYYAVYSCVTLIASDIAKLQPHVMRRAQNGIWNEDINHPVSAVLNRPNQYQNNIQFREYWITSKLLHGNTYALIQRDRNRKIERLYLLDPTRVTPLVSDEGDVYYQLKTDNLSTVKGDVTVPASEIIHDRMNCLFHPLVGVSPIYACGLASGQGLEIQKNSTKFFANGSKPGGILTAPGPISKETAERLKAEWEANYGGENSGRTAVVGDGLSYAPLAMTATDSQLIEQLKMSAEVVCSAFHVPAFLVGVGPMPSYNNVESLYQQYYNQCLQILIESMELCLDIGFGVGDSERIELDLDGLLRMDSKTKMETAKIGVDGSINTPNEARMAFNLPPLPGGDTVYMQQQNYSLEALNERDKTNPLTEKPQQPTPTTVVDEEAEKAIMFANSHKVSKAMFKKLRGVTND